MKSLTVQYSNRTFMVIDRFARLAAEPLFFKQSVYKGTAFRLKSSCKTEALSPRNNYCTSW